MRDADDIDSATGEILSPADLDNASRAVGLATSDIDVQIATARRYPRELSVSRKRLADLVLSDEETAGECMYALKRGDTIIQGPSIRFAEALQFSFGNCRSASRIIGVDREAKVVIAEGVFHDLEANSAKRAETRRNISTKKGRLYTADMITVTGNAAAQIALRNAILSGFPKALWRPVFEAVRKTITGDIATLSTRRQEAIKAFAVYGVTQAQILALLGVKGDDDIGLDHLLILRGVFSSIRNGEATVEEAFRNASEESEPSHTIVTDALSDHPAEKKAVETKPAEMEEKKKGPGRPKGSANKAKDPEPKTETAANAGQAQAPAADQGKGAEPAKAEAQPSTSQTPTVDTSGQAKTGPAPDAKPPLDTNPPPPAGEPMTADGLKAYNNALMRGMSSKTLTALDGQFFESRRRPVDRPSLNALRIIYDANVERCEGKIEVGEVDKRVADATVAFESATKG